MNKYDQWRLGGFRWFIRQPQQSILKVRIVVSVYQFLIGFAITELSHALVTDIAIDVYLIHGVQIPA